MSTDRYSGPIGRLSQCAAKGARSHLVRITFLGEQQDIFDPVAAVPVAGTSHLQLLSVLERRTVEIAFTVIAELVRFVIPSRLRFLNVLNWR